MALLNPLKKKFFRRVRDSRIARSIHDPDTFTAIDERQYSDFKSSYVAEGQNTDEKGKNFSSSTLRGRENLHKAHIQTAELIAIKIQRDIKKRHVNPSVKRVLSIIEATYKENMPSFEDSPRSHQADWNDIVVKILNDHWKHAKLIQSTIEYACEGKFHEITSRLKASLQQDDNTPSDP